jgi:hypothetical protein
MITQRNQRQTPSAAEAGIASGWIRYWWPFWLFRDASRGNLLARAAAYRHNQRMRIHLPGYLRRWTLGAMLLLALTLALDSWSKQAPAFGNYALWIAAGAGMAFASAVCMLLELGFVYLYLSRNDF